MDAALQKWPAKSFNAQQEVRRIFRPFGNMIDVSRVRAFPSRRCWGPT